MKNIILITLLLIITIIPLSAGESNIQAAFIEDVAGARAWGMAGAYRTIVNDAGAMIWNPAGLADIAGKHSLTVEHADMTDFFSYSYLGYAHRLKEKWTLGSGLLYSGDDVMSEMTGYLSLAIDGSVIGDVLIEDVLPEDLLNIGISGKFFHSSFGNNRLEAGLPPEIYANQVSGSASGFGFDLGLKILPTSNDHFSLTFKNLLNYIKWESKNTAGTALGSYSENLPVNWSLGYARYQNKFTFALDLHKSLYYDEEDNIHLGLEYMLNRGLTLRTGYAQELVTADSKRLSAGVGLQADLPALPLLRIDLAYLMHLDWDGFNSLLFSISF